jgi:classical protein kinase C/novel protein kinase C epsilon type
MITTEKVKHRYKAIGLKLDIESRVKSGSEKLLAAFQNDKGAESDPKRLAELETQMWSAKLKEQLLQKAKNRYSQIYIATEEEQGDVVLIHGLLLFNGRYEKIFWAA